MENLKLVAYVILMAILGIVSVNLLGAAVDMIVAVFGVVGSLVVSVFKYSSDRIKEQENETLKIRRGNYQKLLEAIGEFSANHENKNNLMVAHTESWAFANSDVVQKTGLFIKEPSQAALKDLLVAMRADIGLSKLSNIDDLVCNLYSEKPATTGLPTGK